MTAATKTIAPARHLDAAAMKSLLTAHLVPENKPAPGILATEIQSPDGRRVADGIWAPYGRGLGLEGYEIKVSRTDVIVELTDPMKCEPWLQFCDRWWLFVADPSLVDGLEVPERWGVAAPPSGRRTRSLTIVKTAPKLSPSDTGLAWQRISTWHSHKMGETFTRLDREAMDARATAASWRQAAEDAKLASDPTTRAGSRLAHQITTAMTEAGLYSSSFNDVAVSEIVVRTVVDHLAVERHVRDRVREVDQLLTTVERTLAGLRSNFHPDLLRERIASLLEDAKAPEEPTI